MSKLEKAVHDWGPKGGAIVAASAMAAFAWREIEHRRVTSADLTGSGIKVETLWDVGDDRLRLEEIERGLRAEWGVFGLLGFDSAARMAAVAGRSILVASELVEGVWHARAALQTTLVDAQGDPARLLAQYPSFHELTRERVWQHAARHGGDTAVLLQITTLGRSERGAGLGSLLRSAALHMQPRRVHFALTTTPLDGDVANLELEDAKTFTPAMRFHAHGGAQPTVILRAYKDATEDERGSHGRDIVVMRYTRDADGSWPVPRPDMRLHSIGPMQEGVTRTAKRLANVPARGRGALRGIRGAARLSGRGLRLPRVRRTKTQDAGAVTSA